MVYERFENESIGHIAEERGVSPWNLIYDHIAQGGTFFCFKKYTGLTRRRSREEFCGYLSMLDETLDLFIQRVVFEWFWMKSFSFKVLSHRKNDVHYRTRGYISD